MEKFDDLFDKFMDENFRQSNRIDEDAKKIIDMIENLKRDENLDEDEVEAISEELENKLGEPDEITYYKDNGMFFEKRVWYRDEAMIIKTLTYDEPMEELNNEEETNSLDKQLEDAVKNEKFELAAALRDLIRIKKAREKRGEK